LHVKHCETDCIGEFGVGFEVGFGVEFGVEFGVRGCIIIRTQGNYLNLFKGILFKNTSSVNAKQRFIKASADFGVTKAKSNYHFISQIYEFLTAIFIFFYIYQKGNITQ
jgi:hypothetical protein